MSEGKAMPNIVDSLCMTWRHDFGLHKADDDDSLSSGMTTAERETLRRKMGQIHAHHIAPLEQRIRELEADRDAYAKHAKLVEHKVITCGVAARHPDANLSRTGSYAGKWDSPQAQDVRALRADRDRLKSALEVANASCSAERVARELARDELQRRVEVERVDGSRWFWQGDGHDHLESMIGGMQIVISATQLRALLAAPCHPGGALEDSLRLDTLQRESWDLRCFDRGNTFGDGDVGWRVVEHHMGKPYERTVAEVFEDDPRAAIDAACALVTARARIAPGWQPITAPGQVTVGDKLRFTIGDEPYNETVKEVLHPGTDKEELIYNKRKNYYLITSMSINNTGSQRNVLFEKGA